MRRLSEGRQLIADRRCEDARAVFRDLLRESPNNVFALLYLASTFLIEPDHPDADNAWQTIHQLNSHTTSFIRENLLQDQLGIYTFAYALELKGDFQGAAEIYRARSVLDPKDSYAYKRLALALGCLEQWDSASNAFESAHELGAKIDSAFLVNWSICSVRGRSV